MDTVLTLPLRKALDLRARLVRYALTGGAAAIVDVGGFMLLSSLHMAVTRAATCSFVTAAVVNYLLTSRMVFQEAATIRRFGVFLAGTVFTLLINVSITSVGVIFLSLPRALSKFAAVGITFLVSFWVNTRIVFGKRVEPTESPSEARTP